MSLGSLDKSETSLENLDTSHTMDAHNWPFHGAGNFGHLLDPQYEQWNSTSKCCAHYPTSVISLSSQQSADLEVFRNITTAWPKLTRYRGGWNVSTIVPLKPSFLLFSGYHRDMYPCTTHIRVLLPCIWRPYFFLFGAGAPEIR
jgi:hypothetical protein